MKGSRWFGALALLVVPSVCLGRPHVRKRFEPTDLELEPPGGVELDLQTGFVRGQEASRVVAPDFELDLGITRWLELGVDGAYAFEGAPGAPFSFDHAAPDPLWPAVKLGLLDVADEAVHRSYAAGAQLGPKLPTFPGARGTGVEGLLLAGVHSGANTFGFNVGGFIDPKPADGPRAAGFESALTWDRDLDAAGTWALSGEAAGVLFTSHDPTQLQLAFGPSFSAASWLDLSLTGLVGFLRSGDRYGVLLGLSPHWLLFR